MKFKIRSISIIMLVILISGAMLLFSSCDEEEEIPWWEDVENLEYVIEDAKSVEKQYSYRRPHSERIEFNYLYDESYKSEYIPKLKILYKGEEKEIYNYIYLREGFYKYADGVDYDNPFIMNVLKMPGNFRVSIYIYLNLDDLFKNKNEIWWQSIYINVNIGEEK